MKTRERVAVVGIVIGIAISAYFIMTEYIIFIDGDDTTYQINQLSLKTSV